MIWESWRYISNREEKIKLLQKIFKMIIKASKLSNRNINKSLSSIKKFIKLFKIVFLKILTDREKSIQETISLSNIFCC